MHSRLRLDRGSRAVVLPPPRMACCVLVLASVRHTAALSASGLALGLAITLSTPSAHAADTDAARARALFDEAGELERHGQWTAAQDKLRAALRLRDTPHLRYALGWALENDDKLLEAKVEYETSVRAGASYPGGAEAVRLATARLAALEAIFPTITIRLGDAKERVRVVVDGREVRRDSGAPRLVAIVNPGTHVVRVERGETTVEQMVYVGRSANRIVRADAAVATRGPSRVHAAPASAPAGAGAPADDTAPPPKAAPVVPALILSGGLVMLAGGGGLLLSAATDASDRGASGGQWCAGVGCANDVLSRSRASDAAGTKQAVGVALGGAGFVAAAVGAVLLSRHVRAQGEAPQARATIAPTPGGVVGSASLSF